MSINLPIACIKCEKRLEEAYPDITVQINTVSDGVIFQSYGNYGSMVWDQESSYCQLFLCDHCLIQHSKKMVRVYDKVRSESMYDYFMRYFSKILEAGCPNYRLFKYFVFESKG